MQAVRAAISDAKNKLQTPAEWLESAGNDFKAQKIAEVYKQYEKKLKENSALDFDDLLIKTLELFAAHPPVLDYYRQKFRYILVDEYQDTNRAQYELIRLIAGERRNLCVVGDDDQSIYGWRGADIRNILDFEKDYPDAKVIKLEQNYRSTASILEAANQVVAHNRAARKRRCGPTPARARPSSCTRRWTSATRPPGCAQSSGNCSGRASLPATRRCCTASTPSPA